MKTKIFYKLLIICLLFCSENIFSQNLVYYIDIPGVDGDYTVPSRQNAPAPGPPPTPKAKCTQITSFNMDMVKIIDGYRKGTSIRTSKALEGPGKMTINLEIDRTLPYLQQKLFVGNVGPGNQMNMKLFVDYNTANTNKAKQIYELTNARVVSFSHNITEDARSFRLEIEFDIIKIYHVPYDAATGAPEIALVKGYNYLNQTSF
jgi:type VI protein secretion system component Hcp